MGVPVAPAGTTSSATMRDARAAQCNLHATWDTREGTVRFKGVGPNVHLNVTIDWYIMDCTLWFAGLPSVAEGPARSGHLSTYAQA